MTAPEFDGDRAGPLVALRHWWWLAVALVIVGGLIGGLVAHNKKPQYTAESRLIVGSNDLSSFQVAGFAQASEELASNYSRYVDNSSTVSDNLQKDLGSKVHELDGISASPIPGSDIVSVEVVATSRSAAIAGASSIAATLVDLTKPGRNTDLSSLLSSFTSIAKRAQAQASYVGGLQQDVVKAHHKPSSLLKNRLDRAKTTLAVLRLQQGAAGNQYKTAANASPANSQLHLVTRAAIISKNSKKTLEIYAVAGAIAGLVVALILATLLQRRRERRLRRASVMRDRSPLPDAT